MYVFFVKTTGNKNARLMVTSYTNEKHIKLWTPATHRIEVEGHLNESWSDRLTGMRITPRNRVDQTYVTTLIGRLRDQVKRTGELNSFYGLHLSILKVEAVNGEVYMNVVLLSPVPRLLRKSIEILKLPHVAWGLLEAVKIEHNDDYASSVFAQVQWACNLRKNGWLDKCFLIDLN
jgi:hypothetical protein